MANSYIEYTASGTGTNGMGQATFSFENLDVLNANDVNIFGRLANDTKVALTISSRDASAKTITLSASPAAAYCTKVRVYRSTTSNALVDFVDGARLTESDLDTAYKQGLFVAQEVSEDAGAIGTLAVNNLTESNMAQSFYKEGTWTPDSVVGNITATLAHFTKIGRLVNFTCKATFSDTTTASTLQVNGLPYTPSIGMAVGSAMWRNTDAVNRYGTVHVTTGGNIEFYDASQTGGFLELKHSYLDGSSSEVFFSGTYHTA